MSKRIIVNSENGEMRAAVVENGVLSDLFIERSLHPRFAGNIYKGIVENVLPGMQAAFVNVGLERNVFLYVDDALAARNGKDLKASEYDGAEDTPKPKKSRSIKDILKPGQEIIVQVTKEPIGTKGARVVTDITLPGRYVVLMPTVDYVGVSRRIDEDAERDRLRKIAQSAKPRRMGVIVRTVAEGRSEEEIAADIQFLVKLWRRIQARGRRAKAPAMLHQDYDLVFRLVRDHFSDDVEALIVDDPQEHKKVLDLVKMFPDHLRDRARLYTGTQPLFDVYGLEEEIARALRRKVWLACGGYLVIDHTEALTVIDVNTGKFTGTTCLADTVFKTNMEAAEEIARQLRLRNIGGIIVIDFIDMDEEAHQKQVIVKLEESLAGDKTKASVLGFTQLGLVEMTRKKVQQGLVDSMMKVCPTCEGRGRTLSEETLAFRAMRAIKKEAMATEQPAMLVLLHPSVAAMLIGSGGSNLAALEKDTGKVIYVKGSVDQKAEDVAIAAVGSREEVERKALPVAVGDNVHLLIEEPHMTNGRDGIARLEGYVIDVGGAGLLVGKRVRAEITKVFKTYAKARLVVTDEIQGSLKECEEAASAVPPQPPIKRLDVVSLSPVAPLPARAKATPVSLPPVEAEMLLPSGRIRDTLDNYDVVTAIEEVEGEDSALRTTETVQAAIETAIEVLRAVQAVTQVDSSTTDSESRQAGEESATADTVGQEHAVDVVKAAEAKPKRGSSRGRSRGGRKPAARRTQDEPSANASEESDAQGNADEKPANHMTASGEAGSDAGRNGSSTKPRSGGRRRSGPKPSTVAQTAVPGNAPAGSAEQSGVQQADQSKEERDAPNGEATPAPKKSRSRRGRGRRGKAKPPAVGKPEEARTEDGAAQVVSAAKPEAEASEPAGVGPENGNAANANGQAGKSKSAKRRSRRKAAKRARAAAEAAANGEVAPGGDAGRPADQS